MDDKNIPIETEICFSKKKAYLSFALALGMAFLGIFGVIATHNTYNYAGCIFLIIFAAILIVVPYKQYRNSTPQIVINNSGISTASAGFYSWEVIGNETITSEYRDETNILCLEYDCPNGHEEFNINALDIDSDDLAYLLSVYRGRSGKKYKYEKSIIG